MKLKQIESQTIEFKSSWRDEYLKSICAFANTDECKKSGLPEPDFKEEFGGFAVYFYKDIYKEENLRKMGLNERQIKAVLYVKEKGKITNKEYREITGLSDEGARLDLMELVNKQLFKVEGKGRNSRYVIR